MTAEGVPHAREPKRAGSFPQEDATIAGNQTRRGDVNHAATKDILTYSFFSENWGRIRPPRPPKDSWGGLPLDGAMEAVAHEIAERLRPAPFVRIVTHIDTDGITGGAIPSGVLDRGRRPHERSSRKSSSLAAIGVVGAVGDVQDQEFRRLSGYNRTTLADGIAAGVLEAHIDLRLYGRETRPAYKMLQYATDPWIPRLSGNEEACIAFLLELGIDLKVEDHWRGWSDLDRGEKQRVVSALASHMLERGCGIKEVERLAGETYTLSREPAGSPTRDAKEFGTLMNACGRYDQPEVGYRVCRGDREEYLARALRLLRGHREELMDSMETIEDAGITQIEAVQYFHAADRIRDTVVGIAASMVLNREGASKDLPIIAFAQAEDGIKVSARTTRELVARGLDLAAVMQAASLAVGGQGGGNHGAAGATIPPGTEEKFLEVANRVVREQLGRGESRFSDQDGEARDPQRD